MELGKKRYTDNDVEKAIRFAQNKGFGYWALSWVYVYRYTVPNKDCINHIQGLLETKGLSLVNA